MGLNSNLLAICLIISLFLSQSADADANALNKQLIPCPPREDIRQFRGADGLCYGCTDCKTLGLRLKSPCTTYQDEQCFDICVKKDYKWFMGRCQKSKKSPVVQSTVLSTTPSTPVPKVHGEHTTVILENPVVQTTQKPTGDSFIILLTMTVLMVISVSCVLAFAIYLTTTRGRPRIARSNSDDIEAKAPLQNNENNDGHSSQSLQKLPDKSCPARQLHDTAQYPAYEVHKGNKDFAADAKGDYETISEVCQ